MGLEFQFFKMKKERWLVATVAVLKATERLRNG